MTINNSMSITPMPPAKAKGERFEHGSVLGGKTLSARVSSQWKSTGGGLLLDRGVSGGLVGFPVLAGEVPVGVDGAVGCGEEGEGLHRHVGCELAGALRPAVEADRCPEVVVAAVGGGGGGGAGLSDLFGVEATGSHCGGDEGPDDALEVHGGRLVVEGAFEGLRHPLDGDRVLGADGFVFGDDEAEGLGDVFR